MNLGARCFRGQRIGDLLNPVVHKFVRAFQAFDQFLTDRRPYRRMNLLLRDLENDRKHGHFGCIAEADHLLQRLLRFDQ